jgi:CheY-like chemotaxis protein
MDERLRRVLILDTDPDTLITLQQVLEQAEVDTTITWDETEARELLKTGTFDLIVIGDHPPELDAAAILQDLNFQGTSSPSLILRRIVCEKDIEYFRGLGAIGVVPERDPLAVLGQVTRALALFKATPAKVGLAEARSWRAAS